MTWPNGNQIVIDCNVFVHLCTRDAKYNPDGHVLILLGKLAVKSCTLLVDDEGLFRHEYATQLSGHLKKESEIGSELAILRYWLDSGNQSEREVGANKELMKAICDVIIEKERADRAYVYVSFSTGTVLVSNDETHVVVGPASKKEKRGQRRNRMAKGAKKHLVQGAEILFSSEAAQCLS